MDSNYDYKQLFQNVQVGSGLVPVLLVICKLCYDVP